MMIQKLITRNEKGFTLIELMVVVAIIAILATIGTISYQDYLKRARCSLVTSDVINACKALSTFDFNDPFVELDDFFDPSKSKGVMLEIIGDSESWVVIGMHPDCDQICECSSEGIKCYSK